jgi:hypothetical protein
MVIDTRLENYTEQRKAAGADVGYALLAAVTLDGVPENLALGVRLVESKNPALLLAIFASNFPEAVVGAQMMRRSNLQRRSILLTWGVTAILLALAVVVGYSALEGVSDEKLAWPLGFAAGAVPLPSRTRSCSGPTAKEDHKSPTSRHSYGDVCGSRSFGPVVMNLLTVV